MILRKPYAFLIKYFKIIHLILTIFSIYLVFKSNSILNYYIDFISGSVGKLDAINYVNSLYIYIIILALIICGIVITLMRYKKKSYVFYIILILYYFVVAYLLNYSLGGLYDIYVSSMDTKTLLLHRDVLRIATVIQYIFVGMTLVRGLGFDIKKFNFAADLQELNIDVSDDEEVELTVGSFNGLSRKLNRNIREFKYAYFENRYFFNVIFIVIIVGILGFYLIDNMVLNRVYKVNDVFNFDDFEFRIIDSYITNTGYDGRKISDDSNYVVVKMDVSNEGVEKKINTANLILEIGDDSYSNKVISSSKFSDLGTLYRGQKIRGTKTHLFVYNVPLDVEFEDVILVYGNEKRVKLNPIYLDEVGKKVNYKLGDTIDMSDSIFRGGTFKLNYYEVNTNFNYSYEYEMIGETHTGNITISSLNGVIMNLKIDSNYVSNFSDYSFLSKYAKLKYVVNDTEYVSRLFDDKTPGSYKNGVYVAVDKEVMEASSIWFDIVIRNKYYSYKLK